MEKQNKSVFVFQKAVCCTSLLIFVCINMASMEPETKFQFSLRILLLVMAQTACMHNLKVTRVKKSRMENLHDYLK
jgi:hypothetical protein